MEPRQVGRYLIQERLGQGGMGAVYRALDPRVNRLVALKVIPISDPERRARFQREVWAAGRLIHPNIVTLFDAGEDGDMAYIVMELVGGETLATRLRQGAGTGWRQAVTLLIPICQALHYAHSQGVIHRDLKPANILITRQGVPKLSDFGLAYVASDVALTPSGAALGTPGYAAPEQLRGETADGRSDLFSLGVILFEVVAGQHPFQVDSVDAMLYQIANDEAVDLAPLAGKASPMLIQVIGRALAKDRKARYATCEELAAALTNCLSEEEAEPDVLPPITQGAYPQIRRTPSVNLSEAELRLLARAFRNSEEVFVERDLTAGLSGARVLLVRPGSSRAQVVVKLGLPSDLYREWDAYRALVEEYSPQNTARVQGEPILSDDGQRALLRYTFAGGDPRRPTRGLRTYYQDRGGVAAAEVLDRVIRVYGCQWWSQNIPRPFALSEEYDRLLPVHLKLRPEGGGETEAGRVETPLILAAGTVNAPALRALRPGQRVRLVNFSVNEVRPDAQKGPYLQGDMTLTAAPPRGEASAYLRLRVEGIDPADYHPGDQVAALDAVITATRHSLLVETARAAISGLDPDANEVSLGAITHTNPLRDYSDLLDCVTDGRFSIIHGDLNLENVLVDNDTGFAWLIDFAETRHGPALYDLQRLEAQVVTKLLTPAVNRTGLGPEVMVALYQALHAELPDPTPPHPALQEPYTLLVAIRRLARQFLMNDVDWDEYYRGLILTLLGTLKFAELKTTAHALAFAGAAAARELIGAPLPETPVPPWTESAPARPWPLVAGLMSLVLVIAIAALGWLLFLRGALPVRNPQAAPDTGPLAIIAGVAGRAEVRRQADERVQRATFGQDLFWEDAVLTYEGAAANILCENGLLFNLGARQVLVVRCQETEDTQLLGRLDPQLSAGLVQASGEITITLAPAGARAVRAEAGRAPVLIGPRNTAITELQPTWRWEGVAGAGGYRLSVVNAVTGQRWEAETTATQLAYPADAPLLVPNSTYLTRLELVGAEAPADESFFFLLDEAKRSETAVAEAAIQGLSLDPTTEGFLLAGAYGEKELWDAAIRQLESLADKEGKSGLAKQLGDLYFQVGLYARAEASYQVALAEARLGNDPSAQAAALLGLARVTDAYGEREAAIGHFRSAEALYRTAGDPVRAEAVAQVLAELMDRSDATVPDVSPTPKVPTPVPGLRTAPESSALPSPTPTPAPSPASRPLSSTPEFTATLEIPAPSFLPSTPTPIPTLLAAASYQIFFTANLDGEYRAYRMAPGDEELAQFVAEPGIWGRPALSPEGQYLAFASSRAGNLDIFVLNLNTQEIRQLTFDPESDHTPAWSPDGRRIAFQSKRTGNYDIFVMNADGSNPIALTSHPADDY